MCKFCENTSVFIVDPSYFDDLEDNPNQRPDEKQQITGCYPLIKDGDPGPLFNPPLGTMLRRMGSSDEDGRPLEEEDRVVWLDGNKLYAETSRREYGERCVEIKFCPMCGKELKKE
jgi:hypothetical protein